MAWFRQWLQGAESTGGAESAEGAGNTGSGRERAPEPPVEELENDYPGQRLGLPESGRGSVARMSLRGAQFVLDLALAGLVAALFTYPEAPQNWSLLVWVIFMILPVATIGMTPAMAMLGIRLLRMDRPDAPGVGLLWAAVRTAMLFLVVPAFFLDRDARGIQDRLSRTIAIRTR